MELEPKSREEIESIVQDAIQNAVDFVESEISDDRIKAQRYMDGEVDIGYEDGRSKVVATKVRDVVRAVKPSIMRVFLSTTKPVEFVPKGPEDVAMAEQATDFIHHEFQRLNGYRVLSDAIHDALVKKQGIIKSYYKRYPTAKIYTFTDLSEDELTLLTSDPDVQILEQEMEMRMEMDAMGMDIEAPVFSVKISRTQMKGELCLESVPPEELFVNRDARTMDDAYIIAHRTDMRAGDLIQMGFDPEIVLNLDGLESGSEITEVEVFARQGYDEDFADESEQDPAMKNITVTEAYMRMDVDGSGVPVLHKFLCGGTKYELLDFEPVDDIPLVKLEIDPEPHSFYGSSLAELIIEDQDASTAILRGILDNVALTNSPRLGFLEGSVNVDDLMNAEIGGLVRMRQPGAIQDLAVPFTAGQTLSALTYMDKMVEQKTGVTQNIALNPDALQSTTKAAVTASVEAAAGQVEVMVRNLADGVRDLFRLMLKLSHKNMDEERMMRMNGQFVPVDPRVWDVGMDININVGLGTGREDERVAALQQALQLQTQVYQQYGPMNGLVSLTNIRNTLTDMMAAAGVRNSDRYFAPINQEIEAQMLQMQQMQQQQLAQQQQDPNAAYLQAEQMKAQAKVSTDMAKLQLDAQKAMAEDDRERDKMAQDLLVDAAKIAGQYGTQVDIARVKAEQDRLRTVANIAQGGA
ncbi:portal protein [Nereida ignava]|uniref:portal protein n=1 Tax=Nereida ignava TaxID=282199 RepID=UPI0030FAC3FC